VDIVGGYAYVRQQQGITRMMLVVCRVPSGMVVLKGCIYYE